jgi:hypothetical protein
MSLGLSKLSTMIEVDSELFTMSVCILESILLCVCIDCSVYIFFFFFFCLFLFTIVLLVAGKCVWTSSPSKNPSFHYEYHSTV